LGGEGRLGRSRLGSRDRGWSRSLGLDIVCAVPRRRDGPAADAATFKCICGCALGGLGALLGFAGTLLGPVDPGDDFVEPSLPFAFFELQLREPFGKSGATLGVFGSSFDLLEASFSLLERTIALDAVGAELTLDGGESGDGRRRR
jgi:hypothetical protein